VSDKLMMQQHDVIAAVSGHNVITAVFEKQPSKKL
jgi:hypothetical protein